MSQADLEVAMSQGWGSQASAITPYYIVLGSKPELQTCWATTLTTRSYIHSLSQGAKHAWRGRKAGRDSKM